MKLRAGQPVCEQAAHLHLGSDLKDVSWLCTTHVDGASHPVAPIAGPCGTNGAGQWSIPWAPSKNAFQAWVTLHQQVICTKERHLYRSESSLLLGLGGKARGCQGIMSLRACVRPPVSRQKQSALTVTHAWRRWHCNSADLQLGQSLHAQDHPSANMDLGCGQTLCSQQGPTDTRV